jgi:hypothetical protein
MIAGRKRQPAKLILVIVGDKGEAPRPNNPSPKSLMQAWPESSRANESEKAKIRNPQ